ncbi:MAG: Rv1355c family protein [Flavobacteriales bacterium]|nr:Rv1355c family protein [Flavobacteriales bacterium]MBK7268858.1 Rv1355c family protein [Flavobacteriales bacterium]MBK9074349.1 Rv1355c family protein [Flavobacteriales bacterium]MBK9537884.1 Rv1355c family protein [Flavobacteriales bacterium]
MDKVLDALKRGEKGYVHQHIPLFFRLALPDDRKALATLLAEQPLLQVHDTLLSQLAELVRALDPSKRFTKESLREAALAHLGRTASEEYGVWVYYPWSQRLVHLLDEEEFTRVRTDRNRNKITRDEQNTLAAKRIGVIGLSVGQSVCLTMALERSFGELRIADHDHLDLSNLNRLRSGVHRLGLAKTVNVAQEIAEIDPFLRVTCFHEGINADNIDGFLTQGGRLDVLVEECDSVDIKILARQRAKAHGIPVVMDTSDRGMIDVERFDIDPTRPIMHGSVEHLDLDLAAKARTIEEKLPFVIPMMGLDKLSGRMKASMLEIESSVTTWPQLATSVVMGGAAVGDVCRRILLDQHKESGRWFLDLEYLIPCAVGTSVERAGPRPTPEPLSGLEMERIRERCIEILHTTEPLSLTHARAIAEAGALAPSGGNDQPWRFYYDGSALLLFHDTAISHSELDGADLVPTIGLGGCLENMLLKARSLGINLRPDLYPLKDEPRLVAILAAGRPDTVLVDPLAGMIAERCTNRRMPSQIAIAPADLAALVDAGSAISGCAVQVLSSKDDLDSIAEMVGMAERIRILNPIGHEELFRREVRWTKEEAQRTRDGLDLDTFEMSLAQRTALGVAADREAIGLVRSWKGGMGFTRISGDAIRASSSVVLISGADAGATNALHGGRCMQRVWLAATSLGLAVHPISAPILLAHHVRFGGGHGLDQEEQRGILDCFQRMRQLFPKAAGEPLFLMRLAHADPPSARSLRRPLEAMFAQRGSQSVRP